MIIVPVPPRDSYNSRIEEALKRYRISSGPQKAGKWLSVEVCEEPITDVPKMTFLASYRRGLKIQKNAGICLCHKCSVAGLKDIGEKFGMKESAASQARRRYTEDLERDNELGTV
jgi:hypothetical protein